MPKPPANPTRRKVLKALAWGAVGGTAWTVASQVGEANDLRLERHVLRVPRWDADGFRVALLTDLHADSALARFRVSRAIAMAAGAKPDALLFGGDLVSASGPDVYAGLEALMREARETRIPCFAVLGNHDYWRDDPRKVIDAVRSTGVRLLRNETVDVGGVRIAGIDDGLAGRDRHQFLRPSEDKNVLALFHEPDYVSRIDARCSAMLAGHSHGGQVCLPFGIRVHAPKGARTYGKGWYDSARVPLYVSRGVGTIGPDLRLFCPPEVSLLEFRSV